MKNFFILLLIALSITMIPYAIGQNPSDTPVVIIVDKDSLTLYIPGDDPVSISGLGFEVSVGSERQTYSLESYSTFSSLRFDFVMAGTCLRLVRSNTTPPLVQDCQSDLTLTEIISDADVFWYDSIAGAKRTLVLIQVSNPLEYCFAGQSRCELIYVPPIGVVPQPNPDPDSAPDVSISFVSRNSDWVPQQQTWNGITMVLVPPGTFRMGSNQQEIQNATELCESIDEPANCENTSTDESPISTQTFERPFWIDQTEVTRAQYDECVQAGMCTPTPYSEFSTQPNQPVNRVTWFQASEYCSFRDGRLPTEAEWEYAARGPDSLIYPWGNTVRGDEANHCDLNCGQSNWSERRPVAHLNHEDGYAIAAPVGSYPNAASWVGALDMAGNVWEWTSTIYDGFPYPYNANDGRNDLSDGFRDRILRGGAFDRGMDAARSANRTYISPNEARDGRGFRCVRDY